MEKGRDNASILFCRGIGWSFSIGTTLLFIISLGWAQAPTWQLLRPPKLGFPSSISVYPDALGDRVFVTAEHDGAWDTSNGGALRWTNISAYGLYESISRGFWRILIPVALRGNSI